MRASFGFSSPNVAGAVVSVCLPFAWTVALRIGKSGFQRLLFLAEALGLLVVALTGSRGALIALFLSGAAFISLTGKRRLYTIGSRGAWASLRVGSLILALLLAHTFGRMTKSPANDPSVLNRLVVWNGGTRMLFSAPSRGWGNGNSGWYYMQYFQPISQRDRYGGMINSYLQFAVEYGLYASFVLAVLLTLPIVLLRNLALVGDSIDHVSLALILATISYDASCLFSSLWDNSFVRALGILLFSLSLFHFARQKQKVLKVLSKSVAAAGIFSIWLNSSAYAAGAVAQRIWPYEVQRLEYGTVRLESRIPSDRGCLLILPDRTGLGTYFGRVIRQFFSQLHFRSIVIVEPEYHPSETLIKDADVILAIGDRYDEVLASDDHATVVVVAPKHPAPEGLSQNLSLLIYLSGIDRFYVNPSWQRLAANRKLQVKLLSGVTDDVAVSLPEIVSAVPAPK